MLSIAGDATCTKHLPADRTHAQKCMQLVLLSLNSCSAITPLSSCPGTIGPGAAKPATAQTQIPRHAVYGFTVNQPLIIRTAL